MVISRSRSGKSRQWHFKGVGNSETWDKRKVLGIIAIHGDDLLISGSGGFTEFISRKTKAKFEVDCYGGIERIIWACWLEKWAVRISNA